MIYAELKTAAIDETRRIVFARAGWACEVCGVSLHTVPHPQLAHRIPKTKRFIAQYGERVIHHPDNLVATCGLDCNDAVDIRNHPIEIAALVKKIRKELGEI